jgi:membrane protein
VIPMAFAVLRDVAARFVAQRGTGIAASLAFTSILALVPLLVVVFGALSLFPAFDAWQAQIQDFVFRNFVPAMGEQVRDYLLKFTAKAMNLQAIGIAFLIVTVLSMMSTIESTFNLIWGVRRRRPPGLRFLVYWAVLTLGPLLVGAGLVATSAMVSLPLLRGHVDTASLSWLLRWLPLAATATAFVLCYKLVPYCHVRPRHAVIGGLSAAVLFELAKHLFALYVTHFPSQQAVYGAFATVPVFLLWVYLSWVIVLLGAQLTHSLGVAPRPHAWPAGDWRAGDLYCAWRVLWRLMCAQGRGATLGEDALRAAEPALEPARLDAVLRRLEDARWVARDARYAWLLLRDLDDVSLDDLLRVVPADPGHDYGAAAQAPEDERLRALLAGYAAQSSALLAVPLSRLCAAAPVAAAED